MGEMKLRSPETMSRYVADITRARKSIYVYCDVVQPQMGGDTDTKLLRTVPIKGKIGKVMT